MKSYYKQAMQKYYISCTVLGGMLITLWIAYYFCTDDNLGAILFLLTELIIIRISVIIIAKKTLLPILCKNLDAVEFQKIINDKHLVVPLIYRTSASMANGNYQTAINIAVKQLDNKKIHMKLKYYYLGILARAYFELRSFDNLKDIYAKYEEYQALYPSKSFFTTPNSEWNYYQYFLNNNYEACMAVCKERDLNINPKKQDSKIRKLMNNFFYAVACYEKGEKEMAIINFSNIIDSSPKMYIATVSKKYLEAIKANSQLGIFEEVVPQESYQVFDSNKLKKARRNQVIIIALFVIFAALMIVTYHMDTKMDTKSNEYEKDLNNALSQHYDQAEFIKYFNIKANGQYIDALCVVNTKNGWDLVSIVTYDEGETSDIKILIENININQSYYIKSAVSKYHIGFQIHTSEPQDTNPYYIVDFTYNNTDYWFVIDYIGDKK